MIRSPIARTGTPKPARTRKCAVKGCGNIQHPTTNPFGALFDLQEQKA